MTLAIIDRRPVASSVRDDILEMLGRVAWDASCPGLFVEHIVQAFSRAAPALELRLEDAWRVLPRTPPFGKVPLRAVLALVVHAGGLSAPEAPWRVSFERVIGWFMEAYFEGPLFGVIERASRRRLFDFMRMMTRNAQHGDVGEMELIVHSPQAVTVISRETYPDWMRLVLRPYYERIFARFGVVGEVDFEVINARVMHTRVSWRED